MAGINHNDNMQKLFWVVTDNSSIQSRSFYFYTLISSKCSVSAASQPCNAVAPNLHCTELLLHRSSVAYRDQCAHLVIPLNKCRQAELLPSMEVRARASLLREVPVRAPHGAHVQMQKIKERASLNHSQSKGAAFPVIPKIANA
ncbi:hypothetical protein HN51_001574 [Arachis hypogaea]